jgi:hypothetical protein
MSAIRQIIQVIPVGIVLIGAKIFSVSAVDDMDPGFWTVRPVYPVFMDAHLDIADRIGLRTRRPHVPAVAQARDIAIAVFAGLANITLCHKIFLSVGSFMMPWGGAMLPRPMVTSCSDAESAPMLLLFLQPCSNWDCAALSMPQKPPSCWSLPNCLSCLPFHSPPFLLTLGAIRRRFPYENVGFQSKNIRCNRSVLSLLFRRYTVILVVGQE